MAHLEVDGLIYAQPLTVSGIQLAGKTRNIVLVATQHNSLYCFDADTGEKLWMRNFGPAVPTPNREWNRSFGFYNAYSWCIKWCINRASSDRMNRSAIIQPQTY